MPSSYNHMPSPSPEASLLGGPPEYKPHPSAATMLKIHSLLNPTMASSKYRSYTESTPPSTPALMTDFSPNTASRPQTPDTPMSTKRQKLVKDAAVFVRGAVKGPVHYPPYECGEDSRCLSSQQRQELAEHHRRFQIFPSGREGEGLIGDYVRHIPYSSEKKDFLNKTGRDAFDVFQYTFIVPNDPDGRAHTVMWDYQIGLVRITPFFKACRYSKTTPAKALTTNHGLKDLSHSITGGALVAQGYWMPYACARAVCLTFCHPIRWALTPIFGPSFITECLPPDHAGYARFKIDAEVVRCARLEADGWKPDGGQRDETPGIDPFGGRQIPRSAPAAGPVDGPQLRPRKENLTFKFGSPSDSSSETSDERAAYRYGSPIADSPALSPKTRAADGSDWNSINRPQTPGSRYHYSPAGPLSRSLLTEPRYSPAVSWRSAEPADDPPLPLHPPARTAPEAPRGHKRRRRSGESAPLARRDQPSGDEAPSPPSSESDDADLPLSLSLSSRPRERPAKRAKTRGIAAASQKRSLTGRTYTAEDAQAAHWLLNLSRRDAEMGVRANRALGQKRKGDFV